MGFDEVVKRAPVAWTDPRLRALHDAVVVSLPYPDEIKSATAAAGIGPGDLPWGLTGRQIWYAAFNVAAQRLVLPALVDQATRPTGARAALATRRAPAVQRSEAPRRRRLRHSHP